MKAVHINIKHYKAYLEEQWFIPLTTLKAKSFQLARILLQVLPSPWPKIYFCATSWSINFRRYPLNFSNGMDSSMQFWSNQYSESTLLWLCIILSTAEQSHVLWLHFLFLSCTFFFLFVESINASFKKKCFIFYFCFFPPNVESFFFRFYILGNNLSFKFQYSCWFLKKILLQYL